MNVSRDLSSKIGVAFLAAALLLAGCTKREEGHAVTTNPNFKLERLFSHEGCTVYRFYDARYRYYTDCRGSVSWSESCGKNCTTEQSVETSR